MSQDATCLEPLARECGPELIVGGRSTWGESHASECFPLSAEVQLTAKDESRSPVREGKKGEWLTKKLLTENEQSEIDNLRLSLSLGIPVPRATQCMRGM